MNTFGFIRATCITPRVVVGDPRANADEIFNAVNQHGNSDIILTPELSIPSYSAMKLFHQTPLLVESIDEMFRLANHIGDQLVVVGIAIPVGSSLYNCAAVLNQGTVIGIVPKEFVPNYNEFEEGQWFASARDEDLPATVRLHGVNIPFGTRLIFESNTESHQARIFIEVCEAIWMTIPPSSYGSIAGANIILNPSTSTEIVGKADMRRAHVISQSGRCVGAYVYCSSGPTESTNDVVCGGHDMIAECGSMLKESGRVGNGNNRDTYSLTADIDLEKIQNDRRVQTSYSESSKFIRDMKFRTIGFIIPETKIMRTLERTIYARPFVPNNPQTLKERCAEIFGIQVCALAKRLECLDPSTKLSIGISGGLDSTLSLLVALKTMRVLKRDPACIQAATMPGFGTTPKTINAAKSLMSLTGVTACEIDIRPACFEEFKVLNKTTGYKPFGIGMDLSLEQFIETLGQVKEDSHDLVFENVQARQRTQYLMNLGFVLGTGDMSELFQGWCTYCGDHQSMYNVNCSAPKTLVKFLVNYVADHEVTSLSMAPEALHDTLKEIVSFIISPELLPQKGGEITQSTEQKIGPYELIDFLMFYMIRCGFAPSKILYLMSQAYGWEKQYSPEEKRAWMKIHLKRFFQQQYKRDDVPNGPKVGSVSLSPRAGNWRMPSDAVANAWLRDLEASDAF